MISLLTHLLFLFMSAQADESSAYKVDVSKVISGSTSSLALFDEIFSCSTVDPATGLQSGTLPEWSLMMKRSEHPEWSGEGGKIKLKDAEETLDVETFKELVREADRPLTESAFLDLKVKWSIFLQSFHLVWPQVLTALSEQNLAHCVLKPIPPVLFQVTFLLLAETKIYVGVNFKTTRELGEALIKSPEKWEAIRVAIDIFDYLYRLGPSAYSVSNRRVALSYYQLLTSLQTTVSALTRLPNEAVIGRADGNWGTPSLYAAGLARRMRWISREFQSDFFWKLGNFKSNLLRNAEP